MARVDIAILREIVRVVGTRGEVPEFVELSKKRFQVKYLEDHKQRIEEALRRGDRDRLNMLYGQLESKVKYQVVRGVSVVKGAAAAPSAKGSPTAPAKTVVPPSQTKPVPAKADSKTATRRAAKSGAPEKRTLKPAAPAPRAVPAKAPTAAAKTPTAAAKAPAAPAKSPAPARKVPARNPAKKKK